VCQDGRWGYIDRAGRFVIAPKFDDAWDFSDGLARVERRGRVGYIDRRGRFVVPATFHWGQTFTRGLARAGTEHLWGYINRAGRYVWRPSDAPGIMAQMPRSDHAWQLSASHGR
jgi:hypothetical protein